VTAHPPGSCLWRFTADDGAWIDRPGHTAFEAFQLARCAVPTVCFAGAEQVQGPVQQGTPRPRRHVRRRQLGRMVGAQRGARP
jgi:hypothetical protein